MDFNVIVMVVSLAWFLSEVILARLKRSAAGDTRLDKSSLRILWTVIILSIFSAFLYRVRVEEKALADAFGKEYDDYCASTKRFVPGVI